MTKTMKIGIMSYEDYKKRTIAIAKGEYKPAKGEPKIWFDSIESMAQVLSSKNRELLKIIRESNPKSLAELSSVSGRQVSNLSRTLRNMEKYGIVKLSQEKRSVIPQPQASDFQVAFGY
jgi:predicted transcriptional regulator